MKLEIEVTNRKKKKKKERNLPSNIKKSKIKIEITHTTFKSLDNSIFVTNLIFNPLLRSKGTLTAIPPSYKLLPPPIDQISIFITRSCMQVIKVIILLLALVISHTYCHVLIKLMLWNRLSSLID